MTSEESLAFIEAWISLIQWVEYKYNGRCQYYGPKPWVVSSLIIKYRRKTLADSLNEEECNKIMENMSKTHKII